MIANFVIFNRVLIQFGGSVFLLYSCKERLEGSCKAVNFLAEPQRRGGSAFFFAASRLREPSRPDHSSQDSKVPLLVVGQAVPDVSGFVRHNLTYSQVAKEGLEGSYKAVNFLAEPQRRGESVFFFAASRLREPSRPDHSSQESKVPLLVVVGQAVPDVSGFCQAQPDLRPVAFLAKMGSGGFCLLAEDVPMPSSSAFPAYLKSKSTATTTAYQCPPVSWKINQ